ncbi:hypothetical protein [Zymomonas mobilis]|uniref:hypothetical protein n=1 Tax=Zymomonas mobilis TaxID=542 RepID=UPI0005A19AD5|nr:hypothetical protein [Zymomonas mobilis]
MEEDPLLFAIPRPSDLLASCLPYKTCSQFISKNLKLYPLSTKPSHQLPLLNSQLSQRVRFAESALDGLSVFDYPDKRNFVADKITAIKNELLELGASL